MTLTLSPTRFGVQAFAGVLFAATILGLLYLLGRPLAQSIKSGRWHGAQIKDNRDAGLDQAEKGSVKSGQVTSKEALFQLERRAFLSKTWLFVCHRSMFLKPGDYRTFEVAGIAFFMVLGKDLKMRAFHNVCRHRAYTVVRKPCGTSNRFSCKYHGWQYDDQGHLVKAPKFDQSPGFTHEDNGLFEIKSIVTQEGLIFVNFDANTVSLSFHDVKSDFDIGAWSWVDGTTVTCPTNWKNLAHEFGNQTQWAQNPFGWFTARRHRRVAKLLGPLSMVCESPDGLWCTLTLLPRSADEVGVRIDIYSLEGAVVPANAVQQWKWTLERDMAALSQPNSLPGSQNSSFTYQCGGKSPRDGRTIDLVAILAHHQRHEKRSQRKLQPAIRVTGTAQIDTEAAALCDAIDDALDLPVLGPEDDSRTTKGGAQVEW